ncbi:unnamed protein product [Rotaria sordida]|uniref:Phytanoyl-CoA dioxygenase n=1 Tax=Rotaria sordida TaxID=392033 RepID=A0A819A293_9BILA|nr:unnamed protein product [Rotaria sordida]
MSQYGSTSISSSTQKTKSNPALFIDYQIESPRFPVHNAQQIQEGIEHLNDNGYAIFSHVLSSDEISSNIDLLWKHLENLSAPYQIKRDDARTWDIAWPGLAYIGLMPDEGFGQSQFAWSIRGNPNVKKIFAQLWQTNELLVSFDAVGCFRDWHWNSAWKTISGWYHCDQNPIEKSHRCSIQGFVSLTDNNEFTGGLVVVPQSHKHFEQLQSITRIGKERANFCRVRRNHPLLKQFKPRLVKCKAGDLVVFDSRCIHCNTPALDIEEVTIFNEDKIPQLLRIVAYVCMSPTAMVSADKLEEFRKTREEFVRDRITCTHWPCELNISGGSPSGVKQPLRLSMYQRSLIVGTNVDPDSEIAQEVIDV